jgi:hypothetical protein
MAVEALKSGNNLQIEIIHGVVVNRRGVGPGEILWVDYHDAMLLIGSGRARKYVAPPAAAKPVVAVEPEVKTVEVKEVKTAKAEANPKSKEK